MALWLHKKDAHEGQTRDTHRDPIRDTFGPYTEAVSLPLNSAEPHRGTPRAGLWLEKAQ